MRLESGAGPEGPPRPRGGCRPVRTTAGLDRSLHGAACLPGGPASCGPVREAKPVHGRKDERQAQGGRDPPDMGRVPKTEVIRCWLEAETGGEIGHLETEEELYRALLRHQGGPTSIFENHRTEWEAVELPEEEFRELLIVKGPPQKDWRTFLPGGDRPAPGLERAACEIRSRDGSDWFPEDAARKLPTIRKMEEGYRPGNHLGRLILFQELEFSAPWIADGNHRATAIMLAILGGEPYRPQAAYLGRTS